MRLFVCVYMHAVNYLNPLLAVFPEQLKTIFHDECFGRRKGGRMCMDYQFDSALHGWKDCTHPVQRNEKLNFVMGVNTCWLGIADLYKSVCVCMLRVAA